MTEKIRKEVTEVGNSGHVIVPKEWIEREVKVTPVNRDFTSEDAKSTLGLLNEMYERVLESETEYDDELKVAIEMCSRYGGLHYDFNTDLIDRINSLIVENKDGGYNVESAISNAKELEKNKDAMNENKKAVFSYFSSISCGMSPSSSLSKAIEQIED
jgi:hypothetical protein